MYGETKTKRREVFDLSEFVGRALFLPKRDPVISNLLTFNRVRSDFVDR